MPLSWVLRDPWNAGVRSLIRRERVAGYEISFWTPEHERVECEAAVYRSTAGASRVFGQRYRSFEEFVAQLGGRSTRISRIGQDTAAFRTAGRLGNGLVVVWRYRNVLARCASLNPSSRQETILLARLQQRRITRALAPRSREVPRG